MNFFKKTHIHPTFIFLIFYLLFSRNLSGFLCFFLVLTSHEFGHYWVAKRMGYSLSDFYLTPFGACLNYKEKVFESHDEMLIAMAGPCANFALSIICVCLWWIFPTFYTISYNFVFQSIMLGLLNLLPCYPLDGGRLVVGATSQNIERKKVIKFIKILNYVFSAIFLTFFVISCFVNFNPTFALMGVFLIMGNLDWKEEGKYQIAIIKSRAKNFSKPMLIYVYESATLKELVAHLEQNKHTIFIVEFCNGKIKFIDENLVKSLVLAYPLTSNLAQVFKQERA